MVNIEERRALMLCFKRIFGRKILTILFGLDWLVDNLFLRITEDACSPLIWLYEYCQTRQQPGPVYAPINVCYFNLFVNKYPFSGYSVNYSALDVHYMVK